MKLSTINKQTKNDTKPNLCDISSVTPINPQDNPQSQGTKGTERKKHHEEGRVSERKVSISDDR